MRGGSDKSHRFQHEALFFEGNEEFLARAVPFVRAGLRNGEAVLVAVTRERARGLTEALGDESARLSMVEVESTGRNPARLLAAWREFEDECRRTGSHGRGLNELAWPERQPAELDECARTESLANRAFEGSWTLLCAYDTSELPPEVVAEARRSHPVVIERGSRGDSPDYESPGAGDAGLGGSLPPVPVAAARLDFRARELGAVRRFVERLAADAEFDPTGSMDLVLAVNEVASNSLEHGGGAGTLSGWVDGQRLVCQVDDTGRIEEPLAGRLRPDEKAARGRGLWMANQLCDLVQIRSGDSGTTVRLTASSGTADLLPPREAGGAEGSRVRPGEAFGASSGL